LQPSGGIMTRQGNRFEMDERPTELRDHHRSPSSAPVLFAVDDDLATLDLLREIAREAGWTVHGFTRLGDLRAFLDRERPNLLILDDDLPDGRGGDLARELREDGRMTDVPLVVCTAAHPMRRADITRWAPVIPKPFDLDEIERFLASAASRHETGDTYERAG
jgi:DNA-binding response OmpR family regulator